MTPPFSWHNSITLVFKNGYISKGVKLKARNFALRVSKVKQSQVLHVEKLHFAMKILNVYLYTRHADNNLHLQSNKMIASVL